MKNKKTLKRPLNGCLSVCSETFTDNAALLFAVLVHDNILSVRQLLNLPRLTEITEKHKHKFMDTLLQLDYITVVLNVYTVNVFL